MSEGIQLWHFFVVVILVDEREGGSKYHSLQAGHHPPASKTPFKWRFAGVAMTQYWMLAWQLCDFLGDTASIAKKTYIFVIFRWGSGPPVSPPPPLWIRPWICVECTAKIFADGKHHNTHFLKLWTILVILMFDIHKVTSRCMLCTENELLMTDNHNRGQTRSQSIEAGLLEHYWISDASWYRYWKQVVRKTSLRLREELCLCSHSGSIAWTSTCHIAIKASPTVKSSSWLCRAYPGSEFVVANTQMEKVGAK